MFYILVLACVLLLVLIAWPWTQEQMGGGKKHKDRDAAIAKQLVTIGNSLTDLGKTLEKNSTAVHFTGKSLDKINKQLQHKGELNPEEHQKLRDLAKISKSADDQRQKIEQEIGTDPDDTLEKELMKLKLEANKNHELLVEISNQLRRYSEASKESTEAPLRSEEEQQKLDEEVKKTTDTIKANCPVCPLYTETNPVNILEVTNQGFGTIAPKTLGPNYV